MFSSKHAIWKAANAADRLDDWLGNAEFMIGEWSAQSSEGVEFKSTWEIILAGLLLEDDLLPAPARVAFAKVMLQTIGEANANKIRVNSLHIEPPKPGRKEDRQQMGIRLRKVAGLIKEGMPATEAYKIVAEEHCKSPETIRRDYERAIKRPRKQKRTGEIDK
ncbi:hypothetical protein AB6Q56_08880 [Dechloromonas sp. ARDL1]|uniref:hypothetical protein n=1 Tax=Dechloromonas sp. ARDL1 TaxID=3322121 RepID=UPI003DA757DB